MDHSDFFARGDNGKPLQNHEINHTEPRILRQPLLYIQNKWE